MSHSDIPKIEDLGAELSFWNAKGFDPDVILKEWAVEQEKSLTSPGPREEFAELCKDGCLPQALALLVALLRFSPLLETFWVEMAGHPDKRNKTARTLEKAAQTLEALFGEIVASENDGKNDVLAKIEHLPISKVISELRFHVRFVNFARSLSADTGTSSPTELSTYLLSSYVKRMAGCFHDRSVSGLILEIACSQEYNEVAQRMWRLRNYRRKVFLSWLCSRNSEGEACIALELQDFFRAYLSSDITTSTWGGVSTSGCSGGRVIYPLISKTKIMPCAEMIKLTQQQLEAHIWGAANILRGKTGGTGLQLRSLPDVS